MCLELFYPFLNQPPLKRLKPGIIYPVNTSDFSLPSILHCFDISVFKGQHFHPSRHAHGVSKAKTQDNCNINIFCVYVV